MLVLMQLYATARAGGQEEAVAATGDIYTKMHQFQFFEIKCVKFRSGGRCDLCSHLNCTNFVTSLHFGTKHAIRHHLHHNLENVWFVYLIEDTVCELQYVGSTVNINRRFSQQKTGCNRKDPSRSVQGPDPDTNPDRVGQYNPEHRGRGRNWPGLEFRRG